MAVKGVTDLIQRLLLVKWPHSQNPVKSWSASRQRKSDDDLLTGLLKAAFVIKGTVETTWSFVVNAFQFSLGAWDAASAF